LTEVSWNGGASDALPVNEIARAAKRAAFGRGGAAGGEKKLSTAAKNVALLFCEAEESAVGPTSGITGLALPSFLVEAI